MTDQDVYCGLQEKLYEIEILLRVDIQCQLKISVIRDVLT